MKRKQSRPSLSSCARISLRPEERLVEAHGDAICLLTFGHFAAQVASWSCPSRCMGCEIGSRLPSGGGSRESTASGLGAHQLLGPRKGSCFSKSGVSASFPFGPLSPFSHFLTIRDILKLDTFCFSAKTAS